MTDHEHGMTTIGGDDYRISLNVQTDTNDKVRHRIPAFLKSETASYL